MTANTKTYTEREIAQVRSGQRLVIAGIALNLGSIAYRLAQTEPQFAYNAIIMLAALIISIIGLLRLTGGLRYPTIGRVLCCVIMLVPLVNIIVLAIINREGTRLLREQGFKVGLLGAVKSSS